MKLIISIKNRWLFLTNYLIDNHISNFFNFTDNYWIGLYYIVDCNIYNKELNCKKLMLRIVTIIIQMIQST